MRQTAEVRVRQRVRDLRSVAHDILNGQASGRNEVRERLPFHQLHDDEGLVVVDADFVDGADVRVIQARRVLRFALQARVRIGIARYPEFDRDGAPELEVFRGVDLAHTADAKKPADLVAADHPAGQRGSRLHCGSRIVRDRRPVDKCGRLFVSAQQPLDLGAQGGVLPAGGREKRRATGGDVFNRRVKDLFHAHPALRSHGIAPRPAIVPLTPKDMTIYL